MRIISGTSKGKKLYEPKDIVTRPLKDLTKESIFNIIAHSNKFNVKLESANILDLLWQWPIPARINRHRLMDFLP